jgi:predicted nucleotidyltransferase component of viral defense system
VNIFLRAAKQALGLKKIESRLALNRRLFQMKNLKLEIVYFPFPSLEKGKIYAGVKADSLKDLAVNKVLALYQRNDPKDIFDLYYIFQKTGWQWGELVKGVEEKFGEVLDLSLLAAKAQQNLHRLEDLQPLAREPKIFGKILRYFTKENIGILSKFLK